MKTCGMIAYLLAVLLLASVAFSQNQPGSFTSSPASPKVGETISLQYSGSKLADAASLDCQVMVDRGEDGPILIETPMKKEGPAWKCSFPLADPKARFFAAVAVSGDKIDDNDGNVWGTMVYGPDGRPVKGAHYMSAYLLTSGRFFGVNFKHKTDFPAAQAELAQELKLYPDNWRARTLLWDIAMRQDQGEGTKAKIHAELEAFYTKNTDDEKAYPAIASWYERTGDSTKAVAIRKEGLSKFPKGEFAQGIQADQVFKEKDPAKRIQLLEKLLGDYPGMTKQLRKQYTQSLFYMYSRAGNVDKAADLAGTMDMPDGSMYNELAWGLIDKGEQLEKACTWAKKGIDLLRHPNPEAKPASWSMKEWKEQNTYSLGAILDSYGMGLMKLGKPDAADGSFAEAYQLSEGADADMNAHYITCLVKNKKFDKAIEIGFACVKKGKENPEVLDQLKAAFAQKQGSSGGFDALSPGGKKSYEDMMADANRAKREEIRKKLTEARIHTPEIDFTLKDLSDTPVTLSALKGKVVVVDFWATWCGPCKMSFPYLQKVYEKYKDNQAVKFLAVNTWERLKDYQTAAENAKKFIVDNNYSFPVLVDYPSQVIEKYDVDGIPTKFIIDKKGEIGFKSVGFDGPGMEEELTQQIEMLLAE
jgi:thiol-disulfide isomerase/thioredoxin